MSVTASSELVVAGIPFRRTGREELAAAARERLEAGDEEGALALLLCDRDDWASGPGPTEEDARAAMAADTLRAAMDALKLGPVADYFAYRWSDPTYLSGLALLDAHTGGVRRVLELACGIGHFLRELELRGMRATGVDVVFAKCWLAKRFVSPSSEYVCADAAGGWEPAPRSFDLAFCHDALHYLPDPARVVGALAAAAPRVILGHCHNRLVENLSPGAPLDPEGYAALLEAPRLFDDAELTRAVLEGARAPLRTAGELHGSPAIALVGGRTEQAVRPFDVPPRGAQLRRNPLLDAGGAVHWPSERYATEYGPDSAYLAQGLGALPERATMGPEVAALARARALLDLPAQW